MLLRLILAVMLMLMLMLMLGGVAADAASPCCDTPKMSSQSMAGHSMPGEAPAKALPAHNCIGCVPPSDMLPARIAEPIPPIAIPPVAGVLRLNLGRSIPPSLPPPRIG
jgi:hypothetical protein